MSGLIINTYFLHVNREYSVEQIKLSIHILSGSMCVTLEGVLEWILDLLTTLTQLVTTLNYSGIAHFRTFRVLYGTRYVFFRSQCLH
jgi:hypothetical protein